jgi:hypothetical protein
LAMSKPIVVIVCMARSSESWEPQQRPHPWHARAGGGAVHSIKNGLTPSDLRAQVVGHIEPSVGKAGVTFAKRLLRMYALAFDSIGGRVGTSAPEAGTRPIPYLFFFPSYVSFIRFL